MALDALDAEIRELESALGMGPNAKPFSTEEFDQVLFSESYPKCVNEQVRKGNTVFFGGIDFDRLTETEVAILFVRDFSGSDRWKEQREKQRQELAIEQQAQRRTDGAEAKGGSGDAIEIEKGKTR